MIDIELTQFHTPHYGKRPEGVQIDCIVIHDTGGGSVRSTLDWFNRPESGVSSHYLIGKDGEIYECVEPEDRAFHAGPSSLHGRDDVNDFSIGIELVDNNDRERYPDKQLQALERLCVALCVEYRIPVNRIVGHCHVAPGRKADPGADFPWYEFLNSLAYHIMERELIATGDGGEVPT